MNPRTTITVILACGSTTCASAPGEFCQYLRTRSFGQIPVCHLFDKRLEAQDGWLQRLPECLAATKQETKDES